MKTPNSGRPKSDITGIQCSVSIRLTPVLKEEYNRLGNAKWLRRLLAQSIEKRLEEAKKWEIVK